VGHVPARIDERKINCGTLSHPVSSGDPDWRTLYSVVLELQERHALKRQPILDAEAAILQRSKDLQRAANCEEERKEMVEAITVLRFLRRNSNNFSSKGDAD
jgi:hypothetical protein